MLLIDFELLDVLEYLQTMSEDVSSISVPVKLLRVELLLVDQRDVDLVGFLELLQVLLFDLGA